MCRRQWRTIGLTLVLAALLVITAGCQTTEPEPTPSPAEAAEAAAAEAEAAVDEIIDAYPLAATAWELAYFGPPEEPLPALPNTRSAVTYFWDRYAGYDGCNWFLGSYSATTEGELRMMTPTQTRNVCEPEELYKQAATYEGALMNATEYLFEGEQLVINTVDDQRLVTQDPAKPVPMQGAEWDLALWWDTDRDQWAPVVLQSRTFIVLSEDGVASGSGGCNDYTVSYEGDLQIEKVMEATGTYAELPTLTFGPIAAQLAECAEPEGIMDQEQGYFTALGSVAYYFKLGSMQMMLDADGTPLLLFGARN